jgi:Ser/Thr protein kinase RdoA (MazF antagonist)
MRRSLRDMLAADEFAALGDAASWARANKRWVQALVEGFDPRMPDQPRAQCVHGEVHGGNVLFADNRAVLLDFEEATHVFAPPAWDLAYAVQRFCLAGAPTPEVAAARAASLARGYGQLPPLADAMKQVAWYMAAVALATWADEGLATPASEFVKFTWLTSEVDRFHSVAEGIHE